MSDSMLGLEGKTVVVTGSGQGMGRGIVLAFARAGANAVIVDLDEAKAQAVANEVQALGREALVVRADVRIESDIARVVNDTLARFGRLDIGVNNVGGLAGQKPAPVVEASSSFWDTVIEVNLRTTFLCAKAFAQAIIQSNAGGSIVNIASISGLRSSAHLAPYGAAKAAVMHLTQTLAVELAPHGIRVNCVAPASIDTPDAMATVSDERKRAMAASVPLGRLGAPSDVGGIVAMLSSDIAGFVTGQTLMVDGGLSCTSARPQMGAG